MKGWCLVVMGNVFMNTLEAKKPIVFDISSLPPERCYIDTAVRDSLIRYKLRMERTFPMLTVRETFDIDRDAGCLNGFTVELVLEGLKTIKVEFPDIMKSVVYREYLSGNLDLSNGRYKYLGSAVWSGRFNMCVKARNLDRQYYVGVTYTGVSLCEPCDTEKPVPVQGIGL